MPTKEDEYEESKQKTKEMWELTFKVCKQHLEDIDSGKGKLSGSVLSQVVSVLKQSKEYLAEMKVEAEAESSQELLASLHSNIPEDIEDDFGDYIRSEEKASVSSLYGDKLELADSGWQHHSPGHSER